MLKVGIYIIYINVQLCELYYEMCRYEYVKLRTGNNLIVQSVSVIINNK